MCSVSKNNLHHRFLRENLNFLVKLLLEHHQPLDFFLDESRSSHQRCSVRKDVLRNSRENTCARVSLLIKLQAKKETLAQVFSYEFWEIYKNTFLQNTSGWLLLWVLCVFVWSRLIISSVFNTYHQVASDMESHVDCFKFRGYCIRVSLWHKII